MYLEVSESSRKGGGVTNHRDQRLYYDPMKENNLEKKHPYPSGSNISHIHRVSFSTGVGHPSIVAVRWRISRYASPLGHCEELTLSVLSGIGVHSDHLE